MKPLIRRGTLVLLLIAFCFPAGRAFDPDAGLVVTRVAPGSAGARAGLVENDRLRSWSRVDAEASSVRLPLTSPYALRRVEEEESASARVRVHGTHDGEPRTWSLPSPPWGVETRPALPAELWRRCLDSLAEIDRVSPDGEDLDGKLASGRAVVAQVNGDVGPLAGAWISAEIGRRLVDAGLLDPGRAFYEQALETASRAGPPASIAAIVQLHGDWSSALVEAGDLPAAMERLEQGLDRTPAGTLARASLQSRLGALARRTGDLDRATALLNEALAVREALVPGSPLVAASLYEQLLLARNRGDLATAESVGRRALTLQESDQPDSLAAAMTRGTLGQIAIMRGNLDRAHELCLSSYETVKEVAPGSRDHGGAATNLGILARRQGDADRAMAFFSEALGILEALNPASGAVAMLNNNIGVVAYDYGDLARAEQHLTRALALHERTAPGSLEVALYLDNLAGIAQERGDLARAEQLHRRALATRESQAPGSLEVAITLGNLGDLLQQRGHLERARVYYERALDIQRRLAPGSLEEAATLADLGILAERMGDTNLAGSRHREALATRERLAPGSLDVASTLSALASLSSKQDRPDEARKLAERALALREARSADSLPTAASLYQLGRLALRRGDAEAAVAYHRRALAVREQITPDSHWVASSLNGLGQALRRAGNETGGLAALCQATDVLDGDISRVGELEADRASFRATFSDYYRDCIGAFVAAGKPADAFAGLERFRARWLLAMLAERDILFQADLDAEISSRMRRNRIEYGRLVSEMTRLDPDDDTGAAAKHRRRMMDLREEREEIAKAVRQASPRLAGLQYPQPLELDAARDALPAKTVLLSYSVGADETVLFALRRVGPGADAAERAASFRAMTIPIARVDLDRMVRSFRDAIRDKRPVDEIKDSAARLYDALIRPADAQLVGADALLVSPDGPLHTLPFAALVRTDEASDRVFLIEKWPLHLVASATVYAQLARPLRHRTEDEPVLIAFGDPSYRGNAPASGEIERSMVGRAADLRPLPHARGEVENIARLFSPQAEVHVGEEATEKRAKSVGGRVDYLHFACHGFLDESDPLDSALAMTMPASGSDGEDNGFLQAWEVIEQVRIDASLVTLSACGTGLGGDLGGEGLIGLVRAFQYAGARSVVASLWNVADRPTAWLMTEMYTSLKAGESRAGALRAAQIACIRGGRVDPRDDAERGVRRLAGQATEGSSGTSHPYYWSAFQLYGGE